MIPWRYNTDELIWNCAISASDVPPDLPEEWAAALVAVGHDLRHRRYGRPVVFDNVVWELRLDGEYFMSIGMSTTADHADIGGFSIGQGFTLDTTAAQATLWVAETVQDDLAGYEFVQWPSDGWAMLKPVIRDDVAVWVDHSTDHAVARIGALG
jgi:hypothetical protein